VSQVITLYLTPVVYTYIAAVMKTKKTRGRQIQPVTA
jgi:hypothetical protein